MFFVRQIVLDTIQ